MSTTPISNVAPARIDSWRQKTFWVLWFDHMPSFTHWKRPSLGIIPEFVLALERWQINIVKRSDVEKQMYTQTLNISYIYANLQKSLW